MPSLCWAAVVAAAQVVGQVGFWVVHVAIMASWSVQYSEHAPQVTGHKPLTSGPNRGLVQKLTAPGHETPNSFVINVL